MREKILISTGGSGGHVIPALNFYDHLKENYQVFLTTDLRGSKFINSAIYKKDIIDVPDIKKNFFKIPLNLIFFFISIIRSLIFLKKNKIDKIISTGGYMSFPLCLASKFTKSKLFLFEPNMVLGRSNLFFINQCQKIFCYSNKIKKFPTNHLEKIETIHPILNKKYYLSKNKITSYTDKNILLIIGGSQGANFFQTELKENLCKLSKKLNLIVYHQVNRENFNTLEMFYQENDISFKLFDFEYSLDNVFEKVNFCITRAGASTLAELVFYEVPFLAIPFPYSKDNHQLLNAQFYKDHNCCWIIEQKNVSKKTFFETISNIITDKIDIDIKKKAMNEFSNKNTWENNNKLIIKTINEN